MPRPPKERVVSQLPPVTEYKPAGVPMCELEEMVLTVEEMEAVRLADVEGLEQAEAAASMDVSAATFNRILSSAHRKIGTALWRGQALRVEGGTFRVAPHRRCQYRHFRCLTCGHEWDEPHGTGRARDMYCPVCHASSVKRQG